MLWRHWKTRTQCHDNETQQEEYEPVIKLAWVERKISTGCLSVRTWLYPMTEVTIAAPRPVVTLTLMPPIVLQTVMYQIILFLPYLTEDGVRGGRGGGGRTDFGPK